MINGKVGLAISLQCTSSNLWDTYFVYLADGLRHLDEVHSPTVPTRN
jgi:hypothetical protein